MISGAGGDVEKYVRIKVSFHSLVGSSCSEGVRTYRKIILK